jgi:hypothetical protein
MAIAPSPRGKDISLVMASGLLQIIVAENMLESGSAGSIEKNIFKSGGSNGSKKDIN